MKNSTNHPSSPTHGALRTAFFSFFLVALATIMPSQNLAGAKTSSDEVQISMIYSNASKGSLPYDIFTKRKWTPDSKARFVKLHLYLDRKVEVSKIAIDSCKQSFSSPVTVFVNFNEWVKSLESNEALYTAPAAFETHAKEGQLIIDSLKEKDKPYYQLRSLTINFEQNQNFSICGISLYNPEGKPWKIQAPRLTQGEVSATNVLNPEKAYGPINLFDSRFEFGWATDKKDSDVTLDFKFARREKITALRIWNGYQRSHIHCYSNSRAQKLLLTGDGNYKAEVEVKDITGSQIVKLPKPFRGKNLKIKVLSSYRGKKYKDLVISELRFFDGRKWFMLNPLAMLKRINEENRKLFAKAGLKEVLNDGLEGQGDQGGLMAGLELRLRADGSFYLSGSSDLGDASIYYFALGNYEIKSTDPKKGVRLKIFGLLYQALEELYGDCNGCGRDCNANQPVGRYSSGQRIFSEYITIKKNKKGTYTITNETRKKIEFDKMILKKAPTASSSNKSL